MQELLYQKDKGTQCTWLEAVWKSSTKREPTKRLQNNSTGEYVIGCVKLSSNLNFTEQMFLNGICGHQIKLLEAVVISNFGYVFAYLMPGKGDEILTNSL